MQARIQCCIFKHWKIKINRDLGILFQVKIPPKSKDEINIYFFKTNNIWGNSQPHKNCNTKWSCQRNEYQKWFFFNFFLIFDFKVSFSYSSVIYLWLHQVLVAACGIFTVACGIFTVAYRIFTVACGSVWALQFAEHGLSCLVVRGILVLRPGIEPASPALKGGFLSTGPPEHSHLLIFRTFAPSLASLIPCSSLWVSALLAVPRLLWQTLSSIYCLSCCAAPPRSHQERWQAAWGSYSHLDAFSPFYLTLCTDHFQLVLPKNLADISHSLKICNELVQAEQREVSDKVTKLIIFSKYLLPPRKHWPSRQWPCVTLCKRLQNSAWWTWVEWEWGVSFNIFQEANLDSLKTNLIFFFFTNLIFEKS